MRGFQELVVWQRAMELCKEIYLVSAKLPEEERFGLVQQLRKAAVSVPSNIAEGYSRQTTGDYRHHLQMACGSTGEIQTQLMIADQLKMLTPGTATKAMNLAEECMKILATMVSKLR